MFLAKQQKFQLYLAEELQSCHDEPFSWKWPWRSAHCISYKHLLPGCSCRGPLQRISSSLSLSWELDPGLYEWETFTARFPVPACFVHKAGVMLTCGEAGMCWKPKFTVVKCWAWTGRIPAKPDVLGNCTLAVVSFVLFCYFISDGQILVICHPGSTLVGKIFQNNSYRFPVVLGATSF